MLKRMRLTTLLMLPLVLLVAAMLHAEEATVLQGLRDIQASAHVSLVDQSIGEVRDHEVGLGSIRKVSGAWRFKDSERLSGELTRYTWQIIDGFTSQEVMEELEDYLKEQAATTLDFSCDGRACGPSTQWANRVFGQRVLYGRVDLQRYRVYSLEAEGVVYRLLVFAAARSADRQYLHVELLRVVAE